MDKHDELVKQVADLDALVVKLIHDLKLNLTALG
jgi:hypothetical protein